MQVSTSGLAACVVVLASGLATADAQELITEMSDEQIVKILESYPGVSNIEPLEKEEILGKPYRFKLKVEEEPVLVVLFNAGRNMQLYAAWAGKKVSLSQMNAWNRDKRFTKAYLDKDGDPCIESDIIVTGGLTDKTVRDWIATYGNSIVAFEKHISE